MEREAETIVVASQSDIEVVATKDE